MRCIVFGLPNSMCFCLKNILRVSFSFAGGNLLGRGCSSVADWKCKDSNKNNGDFGHLSYDDRLPTGFLLSPDICERVSTNYLRGKVKPYKCEFCSKAFRQMFHLNQHRRLHTGERPFKCLNCVKAYTSKNKLLDHCKMHGHKSEYS